MQGTEAEIGAGRIKGRGKARRVARREVVTRILG